MFDQQAIDDYNKKIQEEANRKEALLATKQVSETVEAVKKAVDFSTSRLIADKRVNPQKVQVLNNLATPEDIKQVVNGLDKLAVVLKPEANDDGPIIDAINSLREQLIKLPSEMPEVETVEEVTVKNLDSFKGYIKPLLDAINKLELSPTFDPKIEVKPADVKVTTEKVDTAPLLKAIEGLGKEFTKLSEKEQPETDLEPLLKATKATTDAIKNMTFPVPNYVLPFSKDGKATQVTLNADGSIPVTTTGSSSGTEYTEGDVDASITGSAIMWEDTSNTLRAVSAAKPLPVTTSGTSTPAKDSDRFGIQAVSNDGTYKYFFFEADDADYYIMRKNLTTRVFSYTAGTGGYSTVYQSEILGPSGTPTWGNRGTVF